MPRRARISLFAALAGVVLMVVCWWLAHDVAVIRQADSDVLSDFLALRRPRLDAVTEWIAQLCNPVPYVIWAALPVAVALLRGRPRIAIMLTAVLLGANETTELLKPLLGGDRAPIPGGWSLTRASWPSGHATAAMTLALCAVISAPARWRPRVAAVMAAFSVAIVFSFLELGWHYPSDAVGGFLVASVWTSLGLTALWTYEAHRPLSVSRTAPVAGAPFSVAQVLAPSAAIIAVALGFAALITLAHPHEVLAYAHHHLGFVVAAAGIAAVAFAIASALSLLLRDVGRTAPPARELAHAR
jgi:membrane-associated phospholipid phosphatase